MCSCAHNEAARTGREGVSFSSSGAVRGGQLGAGQVSMTVDVVIQEHRKMCIDRDHSATLGRHCMYLVAVMERSASAPPSYRIQLCPVNRMH